MPRQIWVEERYTERRDGCLSRLEDILIAIVATALLTLLARLSR